jgi:uncharacterized protein YktA (UPF0223 family)
VLQEGPQRRVLRVFSFVYLSYHTSIKKAKILNKYAQFPNYIKEVAEQMKQNIECPFRHKRNIDTYFIYDSP